MTCQTELRLAGRAYPRTCQDCGLGPCKKGTWSGGVSPDANGWMPIETAPKDGTTVDLWAKVRNKDFSARVADCSWGLMVDWYGDEREDWFGLYVGMHLSYEKPTHWRPLPAPPVQP